jgi:hypothetical protein
MLRYYKQASMLGVVSVRVCIALSMPVRQARCVLGWLATVCATLGLSNQHHIYRRA